MSGTGKDSTARAFDNLSHGNEPVFWKGMPSVQRNEFMKFKDKVAHINPSLKDYMRQFGYNDVKEFANAIKQANCDGKPEKLANFDKFFDDEQKRIVEKALSKNDIVFVTTRLGAWMLDNINIKVMLIKTSINRAKDAWGRRDKDRPDLMKFESIEQLSDYFNERDEGDIARYKQVYNIDIENHDGFYTIDAHANDPDKRAWIILQELKKKKLV